MLGLLQGIAEFLPISSSGHLVLGEYLLGINEPGIAFEVFVHFGTALSIITVYRKRLLVILRDGLAGLAQPALWKSALLPGPIEDRPDDAEYAPHVTPGPVAALRLGFLIALTMIPTGAVYVLFKDFFESAFGDPRFVCGALLVTGTLLLLTLMRPHPKGYFGPGKALAVGLAQSFALIPGISRSGSTICTAIYLDTNRKDAADFSFLMSLPVILGAAALKTLELMETGMTIGIVPLVVGTVVAYGVGIWAIGVVIDFVQRGNLKYFAFYCYAVGITGLVWFGINGV